MRKSYFFGVMLLLLSGFSATCDAQSFQAVIDSLRIVYDKAEDPLQRIDVLNEIAFTYRRTAPDSMLVYAKQALELSHRHDYKAGLAYGCKNLGIGHYKLESPADTVVRYYETAIAYAQEIDDYYTQAACYNNLGLVKSFGLAYNEAAEYFLQGIAIFDEHIQEENALKALMLGNVGTSYHRGGDNQRGIRYYEEALATAERLDNQQIISIFVSELARARMEEGDVDRALRDVMEVIPLQEQLGDFQSKIQSLLVLSEIKVAMKAYVAAVAHAEAALTLALEHGIQTMVALARVQLAESLTQAGRLDEAIVNLTDVIAEGKEGVGLMHTMRTRATEMLADLYARQGNYEPAYQYAQRSKVLITQDQDANKHRISSELEAKYRNENQLLEIEILKEAQNDQKIKTYGSIAIALLFLGISSFLVYTMRQRNRATAALQENHRALQKAEQKLNDKNRELERYIESNLQLENFAHLASHDLREPMRNIVSFSQLLARSSQDKLNEKELEYLSFIRAGTRRIEGLVKDLLDYSTITHSPLTLTTFSLRELMTEVETDIQQTLCEEKGKLVIETLPDTLRADRARMYQLLQNLFTNALRYRQEALAPVIMVSGEELVDHYHFRVADNGIGIDPRFHEQIFILFKTLKNKSISNSSGIGLATCKKVVEDHRGKIWVESVLGQGSTFHFTIAKGLG